MPTQPHSRRRSSNTGLSDAQKVDSKRTTGRPPQGHLAVEAKRSNLKPQESDRSRLSARAKPTPHVSINTRPQELGKTRQDGFDETDDEVTPIQSPPRSIRCGPTSRRHRSTDTAQSRDTPNVWVCISNMRKFY